MRVTRVHCLATAALMVWLLLAWFAASLFRLQGADLWIFRGGLALIGILGFVGFLWLWSRKDRESVQGSARGPAGDTDILFQELENRLQSSSLGRAGKVAGLPVILMIGEPETTKTSTIVHSGLDAELLAGQAFQDNAVVPTRCVNFWYARGTVFVDPAGGLLNDSAARIHLIRKLAPVRLASILGRTDQAPRAAVLCVDCDSFLKPGAANAMAATGRHLHDVLGEISQVLGIRLPVYVLFSKTDRLNHFIEYFGHLKNEEVGQVLGVTLPIQRSSGAGVYAEEETKRLSEAFDSLYYSFCDKRTEFLAREHDGEKLPSVYEFPREFRKLRNLLVQLLVDVCRPSQLRTNPFLRGFYFTGVRPITVSDLAPGVPAEKPKEQPAFNIDATLVFGRPEEAPKTMPEASAQAPGERRVPQWVFLSHLFSDVILRDRSALDSSRASVKVDFWRRALLVAAAALGAVFTVGWIVSYNANHALTADTVEAARGAPALEPAADRLPSVETLRGLETLRPALVTLSDHQRLGPPMRLRWGLYAGNDLYPPAYKLYFDLFHRLLLSQTQNELVSLLTHPSSAQAVGYAHVYDALKAYLMTTSHPDRSTTEFLPRVLFRHWLKGRTLDKERRELAYRQFHFYCQELRFKNPYPHLSTPDERSVETARRYLSQFVATDALYQAMLASASGQGAVLNFNQQYPGSSEVVIDNYSVPGAFTKKAWNYMQKAIQNPDQYFSGEAWVLGPEAFADLDRSKLQRDLQERYSSDFVTHWREFIGKGRVVRYTTITDAAKKLAKLSGNQSPLLALLCVVSENTLVETKEVANLFQPAQQVVPAGCQDRFASPANTAYMEGLIKLQTSLEQLAATPSSDALRGEVLANAANAQIAVRQLARNFPIDKAGQLDVRVQNLLEDPIKYVQALIEDVPKAQVNATAKAFCAEFRALMTKYPFSRDSSVQANVQDINGIFRPPDGALWKFYEENLKKVLIRRGSGYVANPAGGMTVTPAFVNFFSRAAAVSDVLYKGSSQQPQLSFTLRPVATEDVQNVTLVISGETLRYSGGKLVAQRFVWPGSGPEKVRMRVKFVGGSEFDLANYSGPWAVFELFDKNTRWSAAGSEHTIEWTSGLLKIPRTGKAAVIRLTLDTGGAPAMLRPGWFSSLNCVSLAVR